MGKRKRRGKVKVFRPGGPGRKNGILKGNILSSHEENKGRKAGEGIPVNGAR